MFKRFFSTASIVTILALMSPMSVFALVIEDENIIESITLTVNDADGPVQGVTSDKFEPVAGHVLATAAGFNGALALELANSTGFVKVLDGSGKLVRTLNTWTTDAIPVDFADWDGKPDATADALAVCTNVANICADGDYSIQIHVEYADGNDTKFDTDSKAFKIFTTPAVAISNLAVSKDSFNPLTETSDISFKTSADGFITVAVLDGDTVKKTIVDNKNLVAGDYSKANEAGLAWNGKDDAGVLLANKEYTVRVQSKLVADGAILDSKTIKTTVNTPSTVSISSFTVTTTSGDTIFDPAPSAGNELLTIEYTLSKAADTVTVELTDAASKPVKTFTQSNSANGTFSWNGKDPNKLILPGAFKAKITVTKTEENPVTDEKNFTVSYSNAGKGQIQNFQVVPASFDPDVEDAVIEFKNSADSDITVEIQNNDGALRTFDGYKNNNFNANDNHSIVWNGKNTAGADVSLATYKVVVITRNDFGVVVSEANVTVNNSGGTVSSSNAHISDISFSPSSKFQPEKDDDLRIRYDVKQDLDSLKIYAIRGSDKIELLSETEVDKDNDLEIFWDGTDDDDDYAAQGSWKIQFESKAGATELKAAKSIDVDYIKPNIDDFELSKTKFDNDLGEYTNVMFRVDEPASITIKVLVDNTEDDEIVEDMEVEKDVWYAVTWDGASYDYDDKLDLKLIAANIVNEDIYDTEKISVDLAEESTSTSKANITEDYITPAVTDGDEAMELGYSIDDTADVEVTIHKGTSSTGTLAIKLLDAEDLGSGAYILSWNGKDKNGNKLANGFYTYKIRSSGNGSDTETGLFVVGKVGDAGSSAPSDTPKDKACGSGSANVAPGVIVDGGVVDDCEEEVDEEEPQTPTPPAPDQGLCAGFWDVSANSQNCEAISWVQSAQIFQGYPDGSFGESRSINRAEVLKVIMNALGVGETPANGNLGFSDVQVGAWYMGFINSAKNLGIFHGDAGKGTARPADPINRAEVLKLMFETLNVTTGFEPSFCSFAYTDVPQSAWYYKYVCGSKQLSLFGLPDGKNFRADLFATRAEVAQMFYKLHLSGLI